MRNLAGFILVFIIGIGLGSLQLEEKPLRKKPSKADILNQERLNSLDETTQLFQSFYNENEITPADLNTLVDRLKVFQEELTFDSILVDFPIKLAAAYENQLKNSDQIRRSLAISNQSLSAKSNFKANSLEQEKKSLEEKLQQLQLENEDKISTLTNTVAQLEVEIESLKSGLEILELKIGEYKVKFIGQAPNAIPNGLGVGIWETGGQYKGEWKDGKRWGKGTYIWNDGTKYEGDFSDDQRDGTGTYYWRNGERYVGEWKSGVRHGVGTHFDPKNKVLFAGTWDDDEPVEKK